MFFLHSFTVLISMKNSFSSQEILDLFQLLYTGFYLNSPDLYILCIWISQFSYITQAEAIESPSNYLYWSVEMWQQFKILKNACLPQILKDETECY